MQFSKINRGEIPFFNIHQVGFCYHPENYVSFINRPFTVESFGDQIKEKSDSYSMDTRRVLVDALRQQYAHIQMTDLVSSNLSALIDEKTFTVTTGHQLVNFTGPLYFILKILNAVKLAEDLKLAYPSNNFVPIYWMATEDHDYEEVKNVHLFGKTLTWETNQTGSVGRFTASEMSTTIDALKQLYNNHPDSEIHALLAIEPSNDYATYFRQIVHHLFKDFGVVIIDGDDLALKQLFVPIMQREVMEQISFNAINATNKQLEDLGVKIQVTPREINLFYIGQGQRERLIAEGEQVTIPGLGTFSKEETCQLIKEKPADFSPNVVLRPVYEEVILPNLCYIGGGGEINYWLQLREMFNSFKVVFPILQTRVSAIYLDKGTKKKLEQFDLQLTDLLVENHLLHKMYLANNPETLIDFSDLDNANAALSTQLMASVLEVDSNMNKFADAEITKLNKQMEQVKNKLYKMHKSKHETALKSLDQLKEKMFPGNGLQERKWNLFHFLPNGNYTAFIKEIKDNMDLFNPDVMVIEELIG